ncbi:MAG: NACHT domain-containing protein [Campylobacterales bacterium]|nr:NACHT domain-containing protein [Campylobacterales bacterium]
MEFEILNILKGKAKGSIKQKLILLASQVEEDDYSINSLEDIIGDVFESFTNKINKFANEQNVDFKIIVNEIYKDKFLIIENEETLYKQSQIDATNSFNNTEYVTTYAKSNKKIKLFVSYSHKDKDYVIDIINKLENSPYPFEFWRDNNELISGDLFKGEIRNAIDEFDIGLLMVSENFESDFIKENELPHYIKMKDSSISKSKLSIPICISSKNCINKLNYITESTIFTNNDQGYMESLNRDHFIENLICEIFQVLKKRDLNHNNLIEKLCDEDEIFEVTKNFVSTKAIDDVDVVKEIKEWSQILVCENEQRIKKIEKQLIELKNRLKNREAISKSKKNIIDNQKITIEEEIKSLEKDLKSLSNEKNTSRYFALLGDYGMGKTWSCMKIALDLKENSYLKPIYLDLRHFAVSKLIDADFDWKKIIETIVKKSLHTMNDEMSVAAIFDIIKSGKAFVIFDGLDEVTVHFKEDRRVNSFIKELKEVSLINRNNKILFSCRTHYFRNIQEQFSMFRGHDREGINKKDFMSLELLPFTWNQIKEYCLNNNIKFNIFKDVVTKIHNLEEISQRPYSLKLLSSQIRKLNTLIQEGKEVNSSDIYLNIIEESLERDNGKHTLSKIHKPRIMRDLSAYMWNQEIRELIYPDLDDWFNKWLLSKPDIYLQYQHENMEKLKSDLRGATFMVRPSGDIFRFAHTSLQEFFLAWYLYEAFRNKEFEKFNISIPSSETLCFLVMLLKKDDLNKVRVIFNQLAQKESIFVFEIYLIFNKQEIQIKLENSLNINTYSLRNRFIEGKLLNKINFNNIIFNGVDFSNCSIKNAKFTKCKFINCKFFEVELEYVDLKDIEFENTVIKIHNKRDTSNLVNIDYIRCTVF